MSKQREAVHGLDACTVLGKKIGSSLFEIGHPFGNLSFGPQ